MKRRDLIIVAVLVNAGLLIVLCVSALKSDGAHEEVSSAPVMPLPSAHELGIGKDKSASTLGDEVDQVLSQYASNPSGQISVQPITPSSAPSAATSIAPIPSFADDLKAITMPNINTAQVEQAAPASASEVKVKKGDMLEKIAKRHQVSVNELMRANNLTSTNLKIGQTLKIPEKKGAVSLAPKSEPTSFASTPASLPVKEASPEYYTVKNGDNPWTIAMKNHMKLEDLLKLNELDQEKAKRLKPGDQLRIR